MQYNAIISKISKYLKNRDSPVSRSFGEMRREEREKSADFIQWRAVVCCRHSTFSLGRVNSERRKLRVAPKCVLKYCYCDLPLLCTLPSSLMSDSSITYPTNKQKSFFFTLKYVHF